MLSFEPTPLFFQIVTAFCSGAIFMATIVLTFYRYSSIIVIGLSCIAFIVSVVLLVLSIKNGSDAPIVDVMEEYKY